jgi:hypothetical protein
MGDLTAAISTANRAMVKGTTEKQLHAWKRFQLYLWSIGIREDPYLDSFDIGQHHEILSAFGQFIREGRFDSKPSKLLKSDSVRATLDCMAQAFKLVVRPDPRLDADRKLDLFYNNNLEDTRAQIPVNLPK